MTNSPNKGYPLQVTGTNVGTWGTVLNNSIFSVIDNNLGGTLPISVAGNSNINLTGSQASYLIHNLSGALTGNIQYIFPAQGGFYAINNQTTGAFTVTVAVVGGTGGIVAPQGQAITVFIDATVPQVESLAGTQYSFIGGTVTGTPSALVIAQTFPSNFTLNPGTTITFTPTSINLGSTTLAVNGGSPITVQKVTYNGLVNLVAGDFIPGVPIIAQYNGTVWIDLDTPAVGYQTTVNTNQSIAFGSNFNAYVNTAAITYTITQTINLLPYWYVDINAEGGNATIAPNAADVINVNGTALAAGTSFVIPQGASCRLITDANGNIFINFLGNLLNKESTIASAATTNLGSAASNIVSITGTTTITSLGNSASANNPFFISRFTGALTLTYNATSLIIPGAANYTTSAGDVFMWKYEGSGNWRCVSYTLVSGQSLVSSSPVFGQQVYTSGSGNFTVPANTLSTTRYKFTVTGAGGGGAGGAYSFPGGGAGGTAIYYATGLTASSTCAYSVGVAGTAGATSAGGAGGNTTITVAATTITGAGGAGATNLITAPGGVGGTATNGTLNIQGGDGSASGGGGNASDNGGTGGSSFWGGGGSGAGGTSANAGAGRAYGSGGGGSSNNVNGAAGAGGVILIEWD